MVDTVVARGVELSPDVSGLTQKKMISSASDSMARRFCFRPSDHEVRPFRLQQKGSTVHCKCKCISPTSNVDGPVVTTSKARTYPLNHMLLLEMCLHA